MAKPITSLWLTVVDLARYGVTRQAVYKAKQEGRGAGIKAGKIDAFKWLAKLRKNQVPGTPDKLITALELAIADAGGIAAIQEGPRADQEDSVPPRSSKKASVDDEDEGGDYYKARERHEWAKARAAELDLGRIKGQLLERPDITSAFRQIGKIYAAGRSNVPRQLATKLIGKTDLQEIELIIRTELTATDARIGDEVAKRFPMVADVNTGDL